MQLDVADAGSSRLPWRRLARLCRELQADSTTATARSVWGERAAWTLPVQLAALTANATRLATWQTVKIHGDGKKVKDAQPPDPILPPWDRDTAASDADSDQDGAPVAGPISESTEAGTRRFGNARMTTDEVDAWLGWNRDTTTE